MRISPLRTPIAAARLAAGLQQKEFAAIAEISVSHLQKVELGKREAGKRLTEVAVGLKRRAH